MYVLPLYPVFQVPVGDPLQQFARGYEDYLQCPLQVQYAPLHFTAARSSTRDLRLDPILAQPLMDNLESQTYEVFEKDPVKYSEYQVTAVRYQFCITLYRGQEYRLQDYRSTGLQITEQSSTPVCPRRRWWLP